MLAGAEPVAMILPEELNYKHDFYKKSTTSRNETG